MHVALDRTVSLIRKHIVVVCLAVALISLLTSGCSHAHAQSAIVKSNGTEDTANTISRVFGPYAHQAIHVAMCESGLNPYAHNPSGASGVFQIMPSTFAGTSQAGGSIFDANNNIQAAYEIFVRDGHSFREWACR